jgi:hypothetical protein
MRHWLLISVMMCSAGHAQSTFTFGSAPRQYQQYPNQYQQYPPQYYPQQQRGIPIPIGQGGSGSGGIPIGALIPLAMMLGNAVANGSTSHDRHLNGCANGHLNVSQCAWCQRQMQLMRQEQQQRQYANTYTPSKHSVDAAIQNMDIETAAGTNVMVRAPLPEGKRIDSMSVKSPYSEYIIHNAQLQPGHIVTDHNVTPKKNFLIPKQVLGQED